MPIPHASKPLFTDVVIQLVIGVATQRFALALSRGVCYVVVHNAPNYIFLNVGVSTNIVVKTFRITDTSLPFTTKY